MSDWDILEQALELAQRQIKVTGRARHRAAALVVMAQRFIKATGEVK